MPGFWAIDGTALALQLLIDAGLELHLFTGPSATTPAHGLADYTEPADSGYRAMKLPTAWVVQAGDGLKPSSASHAAVRFNFAINIGAQTVRGYYLTCQAKVVMAELFRNPTTGDLAPIILTLPGSVIDIAPTLTMATRKAN